MLDIHIHINIRICNGTYKLFLKKKHKNINISIYMYECMYIPAEMIALKYAETPSAVMMFPYAPCRLSLVAALARMVSSPPTTNNVFLLIIYAHTCR